MILLCKSVALNNMNDTRNAAKAYRKSIELNPDNPEALINLTILEVNQGKMKEAKKNFYAFQEACLTCRTIDKEVIIVVNSRHSFESLHAMRALVLIIQLFEK